jgi:Transcriptional regulator
LNGVSQREIDAYAVRQPQEPPGGCSTHPKRTEDAVTEENTSRSIAAVERAMDVLLLFGRSGRPDLGITEIAQQLGITKAAVHRILTALRNRDLIIADPVTRRYALGPAAISLGRAYLARTDLRILAAPELRRLAAQCDETATLSIRRGDTRLYVDQVVPDRELRMEVALGIPLPLHAGSSSKAMLAFLPDLEVDGYLERHALDRLTERTITTPTSCARNWPRCGAAATPPPWASARPVPPRSPPRCSGTTAMSSPW